MTETPEGWIDIVHRYRLWSAVPVEARATEQLLREVGFNGSPYLEREIENLHNPKCIIALQHPRYHGKWTPCRNPVRADADRCKAHGGPSDRKVAVATPRPTRKDLEAEVASLRAQVVRRRARPQGPSDDDLRKVAEIYSSAERAPTKTVGEHFDLADRTATLWVKRARAKGYLKEPSPAFLRLGRSAGACVDALESARKRQLMNEVAS